VISIKSPVLALVAAAGCLLAAQNIACAAATPAPSATEPNVLKKLVDDKAPAMVSIKFIMKGEGAEREEETTGVIIEATGLVLTSNNAFGGMMARFGGNAGTPTDIKVLVGDDNQGVKAKIIARDTELGLAWVQTDDQPSKPYPFVDFASGTDAKLGDPIYMVSLMGKFFDRAPMVAEAHVGAVVKKPRNLIIPSIGLAGGEFGIPVFDAAGKPVGISTLILPDQDEMEGGDPRSALRGVTGGMVLPSKDVVEATAKAKENAKKNPPAADAGDADDKKSDAGGAKGDDKPKAEPPKTSPK
jgi:S1-C subfamily serine protease